MVSLVAWLLTLIFIDQQQSNLAVHTSSTAAISWAVHNSCFPTYFTYSTLTDLHLAFVESRREGYDTDGTGNHERQTYIMWMERQKSYAEIRPGDGLRRWILKQPLVHDQKQKKPNTWRPSHVNGPLPSWSIVPKLRVEQKAKWSNT